MAFVLYLLSVYTRPFGSELTLPVWAILFSVGLIYIVIGYIKVDKSLKKYVSFNGINNFMVMLNTFMPVNIYGLRLFENPTYTIELNTKGMVMVVGLLLIVMSFF
jgi:fumarate reductase subunit C